MAIEATTGPGPQSPTERESEGGLLAARAAGGAVGEEAGAAQLARLAALDAGAADYLAGAANANTTRAYADDWTAWRRYAAELAIPVLPIGTGALVGFVRWLALDGRAPATIRRRVTGTCVTARELGHPVAEAAKHAALRAVQVERQRLAAAGDKRGRGKAQAFTVDELRAMCTACPGTLAGLRDRALLLVAFAIAARRSDIAALLADDLTLDPHGLVVDVRYSKTGPRTAAVPYGAHLLTCPVRTWQAWLEAAGITSGPAFRAIDRHGRMKAAALSPAAVGDIITRAAQRAGLPGRTGHGMRSGLATEARRAGHDQRAIEEQGGWAPGSKAVSGYLQIVDRWQDNAAAGLGL